MLSPLLKKDEQKGRKKKYSVSFMLFVCFFLDHIQTSLHFSENHHGLDTISIQL